MMTIKLNEITVQYPSSPEPNLHNVTTQIRSRSVTLLVGMTGSGKSTLLDLISGLVPPTSGSILVDDTPLWLGSKSNKKLMLRFGSVFQYPEHQLFAKSILGEFAYSLRPFRFKKTQITSRAKMGLQHVNLPQSILPESPFILSGGQKRRVALASTFATEPDWLFLDEPTAGLDPDSVSQLITFVESFMEDAHDGGVVIATHDLDVFLPIADEIILLHDGHLAHHTKTAELFLHPEWLIDIGIALSPSLQIHKNLCALGAELSYRYLDPKEMAKEIQEWAIRKDKKGNAAESLELKLSTQSSQPNQPVEPVQSIQPMPFTDSAPPISPTQVEPVEQYVKRGFSGLDPRTKWLLCLFLSFAMLIQTNWIGLSLSIGITIGLLVWSRVNRQTILRYTKPALLILFMSVLLAAVQFGHEFHLGPIHGIGLGLKPARTTLKGFIGFLCVVEIGLLLPATTSSQEMNQGLSQLLSPFRRLYIPVEAIALSASLLLRFIPMILLQLQRFSRIAKARGKRSTRSGNMGISDMPAVVIPLILAILKLGEDLSLAMEARGYRHIGQSRTNYRVLKMKKSDYATLVCAGITAGLLIGLQFFL